MTAKVGRIVIYLEGLLAIKLHEPLIMGSSEITITTRSRSRDHEITTNHEITIKSRDHDKNNLSALPQYILAPNLAGF